MSEITAKSEMIRRTKVVKFIKSKIEMIELSKKLNPGAPTDYADGMGQLLTEMCDYFDVDANDLSSLKN